jgi:hypothetical protein
MLEEVGHGSLHRQAKLRTSTHAYQRAGRFTWLSQQRQLNPRLRIAGLRPNNGLKLLLGGGSPL